MGAPPRAFDLLIAPQPPTPLESERAPELDLLLDQEELDMLAVFHKSFNLPGLRLGLVKPVLEVDYYPPDDDFEDAEPPPPEPAADAGAIREEWDEPDYADQLAALRAQTAALQLQADRMLPAAEDEAWVPDASTSRPHSRSVRRPR